MRTMVALLLLAACGEVKGDMPVDGSTTDMSEDSEGPIDAAPAACNNGQREAGETCYGTPISFDGGDFAYDAQLVDIDGDGDLDLVFADQTQLLYFVQQSGTFATSPSMGPLITSARFRAANIGGDARLELISGDSGGISTWQTSGTSSAYSSTSAPTEGVFKPAGIEIAKITNGATPEVVSVYNDKIYIGTYNASMVLTNASNRSVTKISGFAVGALDADSFADVAVIAAAGVVVFRGTATGLDPLIDTSYDTVANDIAIGDIDGDGVADLVVADAGTSGSISWMRGLGDATFAAAQTKAITNLGSSIAVADIDGDGNADVIAGRTRASLAVLVLHGNADGTLSDPVELPYPYARLDQISVADYNGDGVVDIVASMPTTGEIALYPSTP